MPRHKTGARTTISCSNCKNRKKGCDHAKPCSRCSRLGLTCSYEPRKYEFIVSGTASAHLDGGSRSATPPEIQPNAALLITGFSLQAVEAFWTVFLPTYDGNTIGGLSAQSWLPVVRDIASTNICVRQALEACAFAALGFVKDDFQLVRNSMQPYVCALREVNRLLQNPKEAVLDDTLAACRMLSLFEMFRKLPSTGHEAIQTTSWQTHATGAYHLLRLRGKSMHMSFHGHNLYDGVRFMGITQGLGQRQPNMFTELGWQMPQYDLRDELFDLMCSVPALLRDSDQIMAAIMTADQTILLPRALDVLTRYLAIATALQTWEDRALSQCAEARSINLNSLNLIGECTSHGYALFYACQQYWSFCLVTYSSYHVFHRSVRGGMASETDILHTPPAWATPDAFMHNIVDTCQHFFSPDAGLWTAQAAVFPLSATLIYLLRTGRRDSAESATIMNAIASSKAGSIMSDFIQNIMSRM